MARKTSTSTEAEEFAEIEQIEEDVADEQLDDAAPDNVIALREGMDTPAPTEPEAKPLTTGQKVGVGVGAVSGVGLLGFGLFKLGQRLGWWGASAIVFDDDDSSSKGGGGSTPSKPKPSGGAGIRAIGNPPNISGDPQGYNTQRYPHPGAVRLTMTALGYKVEYNAQTLVPNNKPHPEVIKFQRDWNKVIKGLDSRKVKFPSPVDDTSKLRPFRGLLKDDGIPGKNTLNAMEIALNNAMKNKMPWRTLVGQA